MKQKAVYLFLSLVFGLSVFLICYAEDRYEYQILDDGTANIVEIYADDDKTFLEIPSTIDGYTVTQIGYQAIFGAKIKKISFPDSITYIPGNPISSIIRDDVETIIVAPSHNYLALIDGSLFSKPDKRILFHLNPIDIMDKIKEKNLKSYAIPDGIEIIGDGAFREDTITKIEIPDSVKLIGKEAFYNCKYMKKVILSNAIEEIKDDAFVLCESISEFVIPDTVTKLGQGVFRACHNLESVIIPSTIKEIGEMCFAGCDIKEIILPDSVESLGKGMISGTNITHITIPKSVKVITGPLDISEYDSRRDTVVSIDIVPENEYFSIIDDFLVDVGNKKIIAPTTKKSEYSIPDGIKIIGDSVFPSGTRKIELPETIEEIGKWAFRSESLKEVYLPASLKSIAGDAFDPEIISLIVEPDSYAEKYASNNKFSYSYPTTSANDWLN